MSKEHQPAEVRAWIVAEVARALGIDAARVDVRERFRTYGLDSAFATALTVRLGQWLERPLAATALWEHPTIDALVRHLTSPASPSPPPTAASVAPLGSQEPIAVIGVGCRFPGGARSPEAFWKLLRDGGDAVTEVPKDRWDIHARFDRDPTAPGKMSTRYGAFLDDVDLFDAAFFGVSKREAVQMDPQQRILLEIAWEALEDAGIPPASLQGAPVGVFAGAMWSDYARLDRAEEERVEQHTATGLDTSIIPARISYSLGLSGPSIAVNTACSSSLVAVHLACQSLRSGESALALCGGVSLVLSPWSTVAMTKFGAMSPDGQCRAFDANANGYVRGEGAGLVVLKPLSRAVADGDHIYGVILGSAVNNDGFSNGLTAPNPKAQEDVLRKAYANAGVRPSDVDYVEAHGPGTLLGDPIEAGALGAVLGAGRPRGGELRIGSVKTNIGHTEAAAGIAGLLKVVLAMKHGLLPRSLHFETPNPHIPFASLGLSVQSTLEEWPARKRPPLAGVSSFGFGGTNCHVVLGGAPEYAAEVLVRRLAPRTTTPSATHATKPRLVWMCPGQGSQWLGMGRTLMKTEPAFRAELEACDRAIAEVAGWSVLEVLLEPAASGAEPRWLTQVDVVQPVLFAMQVALGALLRAWGALPDVVVGHSMGEIAAAHLAGILELDDAARIVCARSRIIRDLAAGKGAMLAVSLGASDALRAAGSSELVVAAYNGPTSTVLSGSARAVDEALTQLVAQGIKASKVNVDYASHSPLMDGLRSELGEALDAPRPIRPRPAAVRMVSTVSTSDLAGPECDASYWIENLRKPVRFMQALEKIRAEGDAIFVEISAHPVLTRALEGQKVFATGHREEGERASILTTLAQLGDLGVPVAWDRVLGTKDDAPATRLLSISAKTPEALRAQAKRYADHLADRSSASSRSFADVCHSAMTTRDHLEERVAIVSSTREHAREKLEAFAGGAGSPATVVTGSVPRQHVEAPLAFLFTGQGSQYVGMGRELYDTEPVFRDAIDRCAAALELPIVDVMFGKSAESATLIDETLYTQPSLFALEYALFLLWRSWGVRPDVLMGHSIGELACACAGGVMSVEDGLRLVHARARLMQALPRGAGAMAALGLSEDETRDELERWGVKGTVSIAAVNGASQTVISGVMADVERVVEELGRRDVEARRLAVSHAFHSELMAPMLDAYGEVASQLRFQPAEIPIVSNVTGDIATASEHGRAEYWVRHVREAVAFQRGAQTLEARGVRTYVEVGPQPVLLGMLSDCLSSTEGVVRLPSLKRGRSDREIALRSAGALWVQGHELDARVHGAHRRRVALPTYAFQRTRHWLSPRPVATDRRPAANLRSDGGLTPEPRSESVHVHVVDARARETDSAEAIWALLRHPSHHVVIRQGEGPPLSTRLGRFIEAVIARGAQGGRTITFEPRERNETPPKTTARAATAFVDELAPLSPADRHARLLEALQADAAIILGSEDGHAAPNRPLRELGFDSLMSMELRKRIASRLGRTISSTVVFDYPTLAALATHLLSLVFDAPGDDAKKPAKAPETPARAPDEMSLGQTLDELNAELADITTLLEGT